MKQEIKYTNEWILLDFLERQYSKRIHKFLILEFQLCKIMNYL